MARKKRLPEPPADDSVVSNVALQLDEEEDFDEEFDLSGAGGGFEAEVSALNDPDVEHLADPPLIGGGSSRSREEDLFGQSAEYAMGRAMSPRLYSQAAQFPTCSQLRVWKWENGVPVGLGAIAAAATEEDLVRRFASAMPKRGEGRGQFKLRPIDIRGQELGQEVTLVISEHHAAIQELRIREEDERSQGGANHVQGGGEAYGEMGRMFEHALEAAESRSNALETALERERERIREEDIQRAQERIDLATNAAQGVQVLTQRMMSDESNRAERSMKMQGEQSQTLVTTLTSIFSQQQSMMQQSSDQQRRADEFRLEQERQRADRERQAAEDRRSAEAQESQARRQRERDEADGKRGTEREEMDHRLKLEREEAQRRFEQHRLDLESRLTREREDMERKERRESGESERRDRWMAEERTRREERLSREMSEREGERSRQHERAMKDAETSAQRDREHAERMMQLSKIEMENKANAGGMNILGSAAGMLEQFGIKPSEILPRLFTPEEKGGGWLDVLPGLLGAAAEVAKANMQGKAPPQIPAQQQAALPPPGFQNPAMMGPDPFRGRQRGPMFGAAPGGPDPMLAELDEMEFESLAEEEAEPAPPPTENQAQATEMATIAAEAGVPLKAQKSARVELRRLVRVLAGSPAEEWQSHILTALQNELSIYHYVKAVTVTAALLEAGAEPGLADAITAEMRASPVVPADLPYDWSDL
jgi:hypothetical protein